MSYDEKTILVREANIIAKNIILPLKFNKEGFYFVDKKSKKIVRIPDAAHLVVKTLIDLKEKGINYSLTNKKLRALKALL